MTLIETIDPYTQLLVPARAPETARILAGRPGVSLTVPRGRALGLKTADNLLYPFVSGASDGTQNLAGFAQYSFITDASGIVYQGTATGGYRIAASQLVQFYTCGVFWPQDLTTSATVTANVVTYTPGGTITTGDVNTITYTRPNGSTVAISFTVAGTTTATAVANGLRAAWNAVPELVTLATVSGTATFIVTANVAGNDLSASLAPSVTGVGTLTEANTTAAAGRVFSQVVTARPGSYLEFDGLWHVV